MSYQQPPGWTPQGPVLWDYRVETIGGAPQNMQAHLQRLGADGWELVTTTFQGAYATGGNGWGGVVGFAIFKRPYLAPPR